jgi:osmotically inducible protein OsmC
MDGRGTIVETGSGALSDLGVSWKARTEEPGGLTSPEELIAAAHAACFSMALSHGLAQGGHAPERLEVGAVCTFEQVGDGWQITTMELTVEGRVPGIDEEAFEGAAEQAKEGCPVSGALAGNVEITVRPRLLS